MDTKQATVKPALRDGQLEHVVYVNGKPVQAHSTLKAALCALALAMALTGCATCERHPVACSAVIAFTATNVALSAHHSTVERPHDVSIQPVNCQNGACK